MGVAQWSVGDWCGVEGALSEVMQTGTTVASSGIAMPRAAWWMLAVPVQQGQQCGKGVQVVGWQSQVLYSEEPSLSESLKMQQFFG